MRINSLSAKARSDQNSKWRKIFIIWPRRISSTKLAFMETVYRKGGRHEGTLFNSLEVYEWHYLTKEDYVKDQMEISAGREEKFDDYDF